jgi:NRE family putative nickel resistance protein-like MFS transporter
VSPATGSAHAPTVWRNAPFRRLFAAQVISLLGSGVTTVGLALFAWQLTGGHNATAVVGNALMLRILAFLLFSQPAGVVADRAHRKSVLVAADLARVALLGLFPLITAIWQVYALIFALNAVTAFFTPTFEASIPEVVGDAHYVPALAISRIAVDVEAVAAPALAGILVALIGVRWVFWFDAATYLVSAALVATVAMPRREKPAAPLAWATFVTELTHGTRVLLREPSLRRALVLSGAEATAGAAAIVATVAYVRDTLHRGDGAVAGAMAVLGLGSTLTALALGRATGRYEARATSPPAAHGRRHRWADAALLWGGNLLALALLPSVLTPPLAVFALAWALNGAGQALIAIPSTALLAAHTRDDERGRAYAAHFALTHACWLVAYPVIGHAAARWGAPTTFTAASVACALFTAAAAVVGRGAEGPHLHPAEPGRR